MPQRLTVSIIGLFVLSFAAVAVWVFTSPLSRDPICEFAREKGMQCVTLASPGIYERGAIIDVPPRRDANQPLPLAHEYLLSNNCILPGADMAFASFQDDPKREIAFPNKKISIDRSLSLGAEVSSQRLGGIEIKVGPKAESSISLELRSSGARFFNIETTPLRAALSSCQVRRSCAERVKTGEVKIVKELLVAKDLALTVKENNGISYPLDIAVGKGLVDAHLTVSDTTKKQLQLPKQGDMAFGARFFDLDELSQVETCKRDLVVVSSNSTTTSTASVSPRAADEQLRTAQVVDKDEFAEVRFLASDRAQNEGMIAAEARSAGKAIINETTGQVEFVHLLYVNPGERWISTGPNGELLHPPEFKNIYADARSDALSRVTLRLGNRTDEVRDLAMHLRDNETASISLGFEGENPYTSYLSPFTMVRSDGKEIKLDAVWRQGKDEKEFNLGPLNPGEAVTIIMGYSRAIKAAFSQDAGTVRSDVTVTFALK
ncbi:hypothetical protein GOB15_07150 [Sinorhizobium meliloti]|nr:hypothetical protein [Sinorhizobium meliloti]MDW9509450.1 hypothetical protein [Sinorhizobium meliloti]MDX0772227.1 hypothetical protein [Sinorhizobium medicae]MDX0906699.1 hypothetical protein [Sinorhizobium medicae]MDX1164219.1 hypothetical protein [Sinorhizobium medicae]